MPAIIKKSLLAVAVASALTAAPSYAAIGTYEIDFNTTMQPAEITDIHPEAVVVKGTLTANEDGLDLVDVKIENNFLSRATYFLTGDNIEAIGITNDDILKEAGIGGSFSHIGRIFVTGANASGINIDGIEIGVANSLDQEIGNITLLGDINLEDASGVAPTDVRGGLVIEHSIVHGDIINANEINARGVQMYGIYVDGKSKDPLQDYKFSSIGRDVINKNLINIEGDDSVGIRISHATFDKDVENLGRLFVSGTNSVGIQIEHTAFHKLLNEGVLVANGEDGVGIKMTMANPQQDLESGSAFNSTGTNANYFHNNGIVNTGTITAMNGIGIQIDNVYGNPPPGASNHPDTIHRITNYGTIQGDIAIDGNRQAYLYMNDGRISGELEAIEKAYVNGDVELNSDVAEIQNFYVENGSVTLGNNTDFVGSIDVSSGAKVILTISDAQDASKPVMTVTGRLMLEKGSVIGVKDRVIAGGTNAFGDKAPTAYILIEAGELVDNGATVESFSRLLKVQSQEVVDNQLLATIAGINSENGKEDLGEIGINTDSVMVRSFIDDVMAKLDPNSAFYKQLVGASDAELQQIFKQLAPQANAAGKVAASAANGLNAAALAGRTAQLGANSGEMLVETGAWVKALSGKGDQSMRGGVSGYDSHTRGLIIGADGKLNESTTLGVAFSHVTTDVDSDDRNSTDVTTNTISAYGSWVNGQLAVNGSVGFGLGDNETKRYIGVDNAKGSYDSKTFGIDLSAGYSINLNESMTVIPTVATRYSKIDLDSYKEKGTGAALKVNSQSLEVFDVGAGLVLEGNYGAFQPTARLMAYHDFAQDNSDSTAAFLLGGSAFTTNGAPATKWTYEAGVGLNWTKGNTTIGAAYDYTRKAGYNADTFSLSARYDF